MRSPSIQVLAAVAACTTAAAAPATPIEHVVVIFQENVSFDHYFGTYPHAANPDGEPAFHARPGTPTVNGLSGPLLTHNPNGVNPMRLDRSQAQTDDMNHGYTAEQDAMHGGLMDNFINGTGNGSPTVLGYFDGNTVTALWNYAQHFALNDNSFCTNFGPSTPGALNLVAGQVHGAQPYSNNVVLGGKPIHDDSVKGAIDNGSLHTDLRPHFDAESHGKTVVMTGRNVGDLLNAKGLTWGWFQGGFHNPAATHKNVGGNQSRDYIPHHQPFQYYKSTGNPQHAAPSAPGKIGHDDVANHQYDLVDFWTAALAGHLPAVSYLKAPGYQDGHAGYSDPLDEQVFLVNTINGLMACPEWASTAIIICYDDSDGWYDHVMPPIVFHSNDPENDTLAGSLMAGTPAADAYLDRAGYGPRLPLLVLSPYARENFVDSTLTDQASVLRFVEDNWDLGRIGDQSADQLAGTLDNMFDFAAKPRDARLFLDPQTGLPTSPEQAHTAFEAYLRQLRADAGVAEAQ